MRIFLTGASGFIGKNLVDFLLERDSRLTCLLRDPKRLPESLRSRVNIITGDLTRPDAQLELAVSGAEAVVHLAGQLWSHTFEDYDRVNRQGAEALVKATAPSAASVRRFVLVSSLAAAGPAKLGQPLTESSPTAPVSWYGKTKLAGEQALAGAPFPWTVLRPCMVYGPHDRGIKGFFTLATRHIKPLLHNGRMEVSLVHVEDLCQAIWLVITAEDRPQSTYFINDGHAIYRVAELLDLVARSADTWTLPVPLPRWALRLGEQVLAAGHRRGWASKNFTADKLREISQPAWTCDSGLIRAKLGYRPTIPISVGIPALADWYRENARA